MLTCTHTPHAHVTSFSSTSLTLIHIWSVSEGSSTAPRAVSSHCLPLAVPHRLLPCKHDAWFDQVGTSAAEHIVAIFCSPPLHIAYTCPYIFELISLLISAPCFALANRNRSRLCTQVISSAPIQFQFQFQFQFQI